MSASSNLGVWPGRKRSLLSSCVLLLAIRMASPASASDVASQSTLTNVSGAGNSFAGAFSSDGRVLVFLSEANNLVSNDDLAPWLDLFARDLHSGTTTLLSVSRFGSGGGNGNSVAPSVSSNGQFVAFESTASNLVPSDTNGFQDVFVRNIAATLVVSRNFADTGNGNGDSRSAHISADGRYVLFESQASNLVTNDFNGTNDVFIRDMQAGTTRLVSVNLNGNSANGGSFSAALTPDGRFAMFVSGATDIVAGATNGASDVFLRDLMTLQSVWVSAGVKGLLGGGAYRCFNPTISSDGRVVAFKARRLDNSYLDAAVFRVDLQSGFTILLTETSLMATVPQISSDGRFIAYENDQNIFRYDAVSQTNAIVSADLSGNPAVGSTLTPIMSTDGRWIAFLADAPNLVTNPVPSGFHQVYVRDVLNGTTSLVSARTNNEGATADLVASLPAISADGQIVAFDSPDAQLVADDLNRLSDLFVRHIDTAMTELVSVHASQVPAATGAAMTFVSPHCLSSNGQLLAFATMDGNFALRDTNGLQDVFVRDLIHGTNLAVSVYPLFSTNGAGGPIITNSPFRTNLATEAVISADGRYVAFTSEVGYRVGGPPVRDVFRRDLANDLITLVSRTPAGDYSHDASEPALSEDGSLVAYSSNWRYLLDYIYPLPFWRNIFVRRGGTNYLATLNYAGNASGNANSMAPVFTPDAHSVLFYSLATDLTTNSLDPNYVRLFAHDLNSGRTRLLSLNQGGSPLNDTSTGAVVSANSRFVAFHTTGSQLIFRFDLASPDQKSLFVCANCSNPAISGEGRFIAYQSPDPITGTYQIFLSDLENNTVKLVSANADGSPGDGNSRWPQISSDARYLVFTSEASDLVDNDFNNASDIFVRDLVAGTTMLLSINAQGTGSGNKRSSRPVMAANGGTITFQSFASDLVVGDYNNTRDIFVVRLAGPDSDGDHLDDDWEMAFFNTLDRDGTGDFDNDGRTDYEEFLAGTDPTNDGSVLRVLTLTRVSGGSVTIFWSAVPGKKYDVQYKDDVADPNWVTFASGVRAVSSTGSTIDDSNSSTAQRFYRVRLSK